MLNKEKHQLIMGRILRDMYADTSISSLIGFKGGTCAHFFYGLTRFSVDLDFDLLTNDEDTQQTVYEKVGGLLKAYGEVKDQFIKQNNIFLLLSYGDTDHNIKVEINVKMLIPDIKEHYELKEYLGISMLVGKKDYLFASKLAALTDRKSLAIRDIYDVWFFAKNNWDINADVLYAKYDYDRSRGWFSAQMGHPRQNRISNPVITEHNHLIGGDVTNGTIATDHEGYQGRREAEESDVGARL
jgi:predicted nucleotidyltransferase component of viral defense system